MRLLFRVTAGVVCLAGAVTAQSRPPRATPEGIKAQIAALSAPTPAARATAACHLAWMGSRAIDAVPELIRLLPDAATIEPVICRDDVYGSIVPRASRTTTSPGLEAARALGLIRDPRSVEALRRMAGDASAAMRAEAALGLGRQRDGASVPVLLTLLKDADATVRMEAATALGRSGDAAAVEPLMAALADGSIVVRERIVIALGNLRDPRAVSSLVRILADPDPALREHAVVALGVLRDARAADPLIAALKDGDALVREQAARALARLPRRH